MKVRTASSPSGNVTLANWTRQILENRGAYKSKVLLRDCKTGIRTGGVENGGLSGTSYNRCVMVWRYECLKGGRGNNKQGEQIKHCNRSTRMKVQRSTVWSIQPSAGHWFTPSSQPPWWYPQPPSPPCRCRHSSRQLQSLALAGH